MENSFLTVLMIILLVGLFITATMISDRFADDLLMAVVMALTGLCAIVYLACDAIRLIIKRVIARE